MLSAPVVFHLGSVLLKFTCQMRADTLSIVWQLAGGQKQNLITWMFRAMVEHWPQEVKGSNPFFSEFSILINRNHIPQGSISL